jgi:sulfur relay protein TusB/DsrH
MATLHLIFSPAGAESCIEVAAQADTLLLIEDGTYVVLSETSRALHALSGDVASRGLASRTGENVTLIGYPEMVELATSHSPIVSWH